ncbi:MAG: hypothetical protein AAFP18_15740 [Bacteroidota bacterium]
MAPFDLIDPESPGAFGSAPKRNAYVELHNMVAAATSVYEFGPADTIRIGRDHDVDFLGDGTDGAGDFATERGDLYADFLRHHIADGDLTPAERADAAYLARTLFLERAALKRIHARVFGHTVAQVISDDCLDADEQLLLFTLQHTLGLDPGDAEASYERAARERLLQRIAHALCDGELDPDEAAEIRAMETNLGVTVPERVAAMLATAAERHRLLRGTLRPLATPPPVPVRDDEQVFWTGFGHWTETQKPLGVQANRVPFLRRSSLQRVIGKLRRRRSNAAGRLVLTDERLLLSRHRSGKRPRKVALRKVVDVTHEDGFVLLVRDGKIDWLLRLDDEAPVFATMIQRMIADRAVRHQAKIERDRAVRRAEEAQWKRGDRSTSADVQARLREHEAYAEQVRARIAEREQQASPSLDSLSRYRGPLLFQPDRDETVYFSATARWHADEAVRRAVASDPRVPGDTIDQQRAILDRQHDARGEGTLYLTNKRLLLIDPRRDTVLFPVPTISGVIVRNDSVEVERHGAMGRVIVLGDRMELATLLRRLVWEAT